MDVDMMQDWTLFVVSGELVPDTEKEGWRGFIGMEETCEKHYNVGQTKWRRLLDVGEVARMGTKHGRDLNKNPQCGERKQSEKQSDIQENREKHRGKALGCLTL